MGACSRAAGLLHTGHKRARARVGGATQAAPLGIILNILLSRLRAKSDQPPPKPKFLLGAALATPARSRGAPPWHVHTTCVCICARVCVGVRLRLPKGRQGSGEGGIEQKGSLGRMAIAVYPRGVCVASAAACALAAQEAHLSTLAASERLAAAGPPANQPPVHCRKLPSPTARLLFPTRLSSRSASSLPRPPENGCRLLRIGASIWPPCTHGMALVALMAREGGRPVATAHRLQRYRTRACVRSSEQMQ